MHLPRQVIILFSCMLLLVGYACAQKVGEVATDFSLVDISDRIVKLSDFKGKNVILVFYASHS